MFKFMVQNLTGHETIEFAKDEAGVAAAMEKFEALIKDGHTAATRKAGTTDFSVIRDGHRIEDETVFLRAMQGG
jgi:hypothetical protein